MRRLDAVEAQLGQCGILRERLEFLPGGAALSAEEAQGALRVLDGVLEGQGGVQGADSRGAHGETVQMFVVLPPGYRLWLQTGSLHLGTAELAFGDLSTLVTPTPAPASAPAARIAASTDRTATSGVVAFSVPVTQFF